MKEFHIINIGNSLLTNFQKTNNGKELGVDKISISAENEWKEKLEDKTFLEKIKEFIFLEEMKSCAELNSFLRIVKDKTNKEISVYPLGTKTYSNEICRMTIEQYLKKKGYQIFTPRKIPGYFLEETHYTQEIAKSEFEKGISQILDRIVYLIKKKQEEGYKVFINPTGGFKAHVISCAIGGFLLGATVYYIHEEFKELVILPPLFYLPKGKEIELLNMIKDEPKSGNEYTELEKKYSNEIERLEIYGLIEKEKDEVTSKYYRLLITNRGKLYLKLKEEV